MYLDVEGLSSLDAQLTGGTEVTRRERESSQESSGGKSGLSGGIGASGVTIGAKTEASQSRQHRIEVGRDYVIRGEHLLSRVEAAFQNSDSLLHVHSVGDLATVFEEQLPLYVLGRAPFRIQRREDSLDYLHAVKRDLFFALEVDQSAIAEGFTFWPQIYMGGSLSKSPEVRFDKDGEPIIGCTSHFAMFLRSLVAGSHLGLFGHLSRAAEVLYIKPYAIWV